jgi:hypothetical protein
MRTVEPNAITLTDEFAPRPMRDAAEAGGSL